MEIISYKQAQRLVIELNLSFIAHHHNLKYQPAEEIC